MIRQTPWLYIKTISNPNSSVQFSQLCHHNSSPMFRYAVLIALVLPALALAGDVVETRACSDDRPVPREVRVQNCPSTPCELVRGSDANMEMDFTARE